MNGAIRKYKIDKSVFIIMIIKKIHVKLFKHKKYMYLKKHHPNIIHKILQPQEWLEK